MKPLTVSIIEKIEVTVKPLGPDYVLGFQFRGKDDTGKEAQYAANYAAHYTGETMNPANTDEMILTILKELMDSRRKTEMETA